MEQVFSIYKIDKPSSPEHEGEFQFHGRALKLLKLNQVVYLTDDHNYPAIITGIVSYENSLDEIEPVMGCSITVKTDSRLPDNLEALYS